MRSIVRQDYVTLNIEIIGNDQELALKKFRKVSDTQFQTVTQTAPTFHDSEQRFGVTATSSKINKLCQQEGVQHLNTRDSLVESGEGGTGPAALIGFYNTIDLTSDQELQLFLDSNSYIITTGQTVCVHDFMQNMTFSD